MKKINRIYYIFHTEKYRIGFASQKVWIENDKELKNWFFNYYESFPDCNTAIIQLFILGFGFGKKIKP